MIWASGTGWQDQADSTDLLDAEEIAFYAEGLLLEGFHLHWQLCAGDGAPRFVRLFFWQDQRPAPIPLPLALTLLAEGHWPTADTPDAPPPETAFQTLHHACAALGTRLFTVTICDHAMGVVHRAYTSHPLEYPAQGTKPMTRDAWYEQVIVNHQYFLANTAAEFEQVFFDHVLITSMGLGSALNLPVVDAAGDVAGTLNLLAEPQHFTPARLLAYQNLAALHHAGLLKAMA